MANKSARPVYVAILGAPGAGKGTMCHKIAEDPTFKHLAIYHLSVGDYMRDRAKSGTLAPDTAKAMAEQTLVPGEQIVELLENKLKEERKNGWRVFLLDGFPRNFDQLENFVSEVGPLAFAIHIQCIEKVALQRYLHRARNGDNEELFHKRYTQFASNDKPLVRHFQKDSTLIGICSDLEACSNPDEIYHDLRIILEAYLKKSGIWETEMKVGAS